jgi:hypothetical protein
VYTGPQISDKLFETHVECAEFVNTVAQGEVVDENFEFQFASIDGLMFKGGCYTTEQYKNLLDKLGI